MQGVTEGWAGYIFSYFMENVEQKPRILFISAFLAASSHFVNATSS